MEEISRFNVATLGENYANSSEHIPQAYGKNGSVE